MSARRVRERYIAGPPLRLRELAQEMGRTFPSVAVFASRLGLGDRSKNRVHGRKDNRKFKGDDAALRAHMSASGKTWHATHQHPRGALGLKHTEASKKKMSEASRAAWANPSSAFNSTEFRDRLSDRSAAWSQSQIKAKTYHPYSRAARGYRADLGDIFFRSAWEANYARYLNLMISRGECAAWEYEPHTFWFETIRRGVRSYTPDFKVTFPDGRHEWHEVKGWMDPKSKTKLARMAKYHPKERVIVIGEEWFKQANRGGLARVVPGWEHKPRRTKS